LTGAVNTGNYMSRLKCQRGRAICSIRSTPTLQIHYAN